MACEPHKRTPVPAWFKDVWRCFTISLIADDWHPEVLSKLDPQEWVELLASTGTQLVQLQAKCHAGNAYYVTDVDHTHMGQRGRDAFGEMLAGLHACGIKVQANYSTVFDNYWFVRHPEWRMRDAQGRDSKDLLIWGGQPPILCPNSPYRDVLFRQLKAFGEKYDIDLLFLDMPAFWIPLCHCPSCRERYRREMHAELPPVKDWSSPAYRAYVSWRNDCLYEFTKAAIDAFHEVRPEVPVTYNCPRLMELFPGHGTLPMVDLADFVAGDPLAGDPSAPAVSLACSAWDNMSPIHPVQMAMGRFHGHESQHVGMKSPEVLAAGAFAAWAHASSVLFIDANNADGTLYRSVYPAIAAVFDQERAVEPYLGGEKIRCIGVYTSVDTRNYWYEAQSHSDANRYLAKVRETYAAFQQQHLPVDILCRLNLADLARYDLLVLPDVLCMSAEEVEAIRRYVAEGGCLLATHQTSLADENGDNRPNLALADVLGVDWLGETENGETYTLMPRELCRAAGIPEDMEVKLESQTVVNARPGTEVLGEIVLPVTNRVNNQHRWISCWGNPPQVHSGYPGIVLNRYGRGRTCYVAGHLGSPVFDEQLRLCAQLGRVLLAGKVIPLEAQAPAPIVFTGFRQPEHRRIVLHLVNFQDKSPFIPVRDIPITLRLHEGVCVRDVTLQPGGAAVPFEQRGNEVTLRAPEVRVYQMLVLALG